MPRIERLTVSAHTIPTDAPEGDGTLAWDRTTLVLVRVAAAGVRGLGYTYGEVADAALVRDRLAEVVAGAEANDIPRLWRAMQDAVRNAGRPGVAARAIAATDIALWDLKARLLGVPLAVLLGRAWNDVSLYGSGGFTSYGLERLRRQAADWAAAGFAAVKVKVGAAPRDDARRVAAVREAIGPGVHLYVDANGAYERKQALAMAHSFAAAGVTRFEEPVTSDDLEGLRLLRDRAPPGMGIAAGEYGYEATYFRRMVAAGAVDVLQADATRCLGISGFLEAAVLARAWHLPLSAHTAPAVHLHSCCAVPGPVDLEYFHDHVRIEAMVFDGVPTPASGRLAPDLQRPGLGLEPKERELERFA